VLAARGAAGVYAELTSDRRHDRAVAAATMALFWGVSVSLYLNRHWAAPVSKACRARSGRDWMPNIS
jgi:hypothetical protein